MNVKLWCYQALKYINKRRLNFQRQVILKLTDESQKQIRYFPKKISSALLITSNDRYGDALFVLGLAKKLNDFGIRVSIATLNDAVAVFKYNHCVSNIISFEAVDSITNLNFDIAVDLEYLGIRKWRLRLPLLKKISCYKITTSSYCKNLNLFDEYIDYSKTSHVGKRLALIYQKLTSDNAIDVIFPYIDLTAVKYTEFPDCFDNGKKIIYLNAKAGDKDRWFSDEQLLALSNVFEQYKDRVAVFVNPSSPKVVEKLNKSYCHILKKIDFKKFCLFISHCNLVVTPDTSVTHIAGCFNIPTFVVFPPNDRDYYHKYSAAEVWGALTDDSITVTTDDKNLIIDPYGFGYSNLKVRPINTIDKTWLAQKLDNYLHCLSL